MRCALIVAVVVAFVTALPGAAATAPGLPKVTLIGDSVADAIRGRQRARCRRCSKGKRRAADRALPERRRGQLSRQRRRPTDRSSSSSSRSGRRLGPYVVVEVGYNEPQDEFGQDVENALAAFHTAGVQHVWWLDMRASVGPYPELNETLATEATAHADYLSVIDWDGYSKTIPSGSRATASTSWHPAPRRWQRSSTRPSSPPASRCEPVRITTATLPVARKGKPYTVKLAAADGLAPDHWSLLERAPPGLHLLQSGLLTGAPRVVGSYLVRLRVTDAAGSSIRVRSRYASSVDRGVEPN